jgi:hypothetical protein
MNRTMLGALAGLFVLAAPLSARIIEPPPVSDRVAASAAIVTGKITAIERRTVKAKDGTEYRIAVVKIDEGLLGAWGLTHVKVGFVPTPYHDNWENLRVGQEGCFILSKVAGQPFLVIPSYDRRLLKSEYVEHYEKNLAAIRRCARALENAAAGLKSKDPEERYLAAAMLVKKYRGPRGEPGKFEPIPLAQSKPILEALASVATWRNNREDRGLNPSTVFYQLGEKPGWTSPGSFDQFVEAAPKWLKANAGTYRLQGRVENE